MTLTMRNDLNKVMYLIEFIKVGSSGRIRTYNPSVNSPGNLISFDMRGIVIGSDALREATRFHELTAAAA
jgi:hypothetical protein